jgi:cytoskeleton protein RodZ
MTKGATFAMPMTSNIDRKTFGGILKDARENAGYDVDTLARRLHIRSDIVRAIEAADFREMPASGYAKNMIRSYARTVGLNQNEISELYLRELRQFERGRNIDERHDMHEVNSTITGGEGRRGGYRSSSRIRQERAARENKTPKRSYSSRGSRRQTTTKSMSSTFSLGGLPRPSVPSVSVDKNSLIKIGVVAVIVILVIVICMMLFGGSKQQTEEVPTMPISGLTDTSNQSNGDNQNSQVTKTKATFQFSVESGNKSYCTVTRNGASELSEVVEGPATKTYEVTGTIVFATANPTPVTAKLDNQEVQLTVDSTTGYYTYSYDFVANNQTSTTTNSTNSQN